MGSSGVAPVTIGSIIDILKGLRLAVKEQRIADNLLVDIGFESLVNSNEFIIMETHCIESPYAIWYDPILHDNYFVLNSERFLNNYTDLDGLTTNLLTLFDRNLADACTFLREPPRIGIFNEKIYDPTPLGIPIDEILVDEIILYDVSRVVTDA